ncbi:pirin family protein [Paenibacillus chondroitinus]|uniref:Pirin family protein n=1 Tax=Paenibacillus chondroitinus TaxID=59842 RepID=A0ABU6DFA7_9BACL|nr:MULTISPECIES: pirin family protein [Paenibacillus]MCY9659232.1 pirin family protein [Paenibacillus anseongense]MEB4796433.1 pirin family protein [Paenibacillus chondroitinus]
MNIQILGPEFQGKESFDGGRIYAQKPLGFSGQGAATVRLGPLFYWSWGHAVKEGGIGFHPHQGFEILTYGINGKGTHRDTLGTESTLEAGDVQLMQTGSGMQHAETVGAGYEGFQIWLEPYLQEALNRKPMYTFFHDEEFPRSSHDGINVKTVVGEGSPIQKLVTDVNMYDIEVEAGATYVHRLLPNRTFAALAFRGKSGILWTTEANRVSFTNKDFAIVQTEEEVEVNIRAEDEKLRLFIVEIPTKVDYPLYNKAR